MQKIHVLLIDFDGCMPYKRFRDFVRETMIRILADYEARVVVAIGSARQTTISDLYSETQYKTGFCFYQIEEMVESFLQQNPRFRGRVEFDPFIHEDMIMLQEAGHYVRRSKTLSLAQRSNLISEATNQHRRQWNPDFYIGIPLYWDHFKIHLILSQAWRAIARFPNSPIKVMLLDDVEEILTAAQTFFTQYPHMLPPVSIQLNHYDSGRELLHPFPVVKGTGLPVQCKNMQDLSDAIYEFNAFYTTRLENPAMQLRTFIYEGSRHPQLFHLLLSFVNKHGWEKTFSWIDEAIARSSNKQSRLSFCYSHLFIIAAIRNEELIGERLCADAEIQPLKILYQGQEQTCRQVTTRASHWGFYKIFKERFDRVQLDFCVTDLFYALKGGEFIVADEMLERLLSTLKTNGHESKILCWTIQFDGRVLFQKLARKWGSHLFTGFKLASVTEPDETIDDFYQLLGERELNHLMEQCFLAKNAGLLNLFLSFEKKKVRPTRMLTNLLAIAMILTYQEMPIDAFLETYLSVTAPDILGTINKLLKLYHEPGRDNCSGLSRFFWGQVAEITDALALQSLMVEQMKHMVIKMRDYQHFFTTGLLQEDELRALNVVVHRKHEATPSILIFEKLIQQLLIKRCARQQAPYLQTSSYAQWSDVAKHYRSYRLIMEGTFHAEPCSQQKFDEFAKIYCSREVVPLIRQRTGPGHWYQSVSQELKILADHYPVSHLARRAIYALKIYLALINPQSEAAYQEALKLWARSTLPDVSQPNLALCEGYKKVTWCCCIFTPPFSGNLLNELVKLYPKYLERDSELEEMLLDSTPIEDDADMMVML